MFTFLLIALFSAVLLFLAVEFLSRLYLRAAPYHVLRPNLTHTIAPNPEILPTLEPLVRYRTNKMGERGIALPESSDYHKVLCLGGSAFECLFLDQENSICGNLQQQLGDLQCFQGKPVHVGNISRSRVGVRTEKLMLDKALPNYSHVDVMVLQAGASDMVSWLEAGADPEGVLGYKGVDEAFDAHPELNFGFSYEGLAIRKIMGRWKSTRPRHFAKAGRRYREVRDMRANATTTIDDVPTMEGFLKHVRQGFNELIDSSEAPGRTVIVARQPWFEKDKFTDEELATFWHGAVGNSFRKHSDTFYSARVLCEVMSAIDKVVAEVCVERGVRSLDLKNLIPPTLEYYYDQIHLTTAGSALVATAIAEAIELERGTGAANNSANTVSSSQNRPAA